MPADSGLFSSSVKYIPLILSGVLLNAAAQLMLKKGMINIGHFEFTPSGILPIIGQTATNLFIVGGLACYVLSVGIWMLVLSRVEVSWAYPFLSVGYIVTAVVAYAAFGEDLSPSRIIGILLICLGVIFISRS
ncbi:MAG: EamA family transporter [Gammaproteobacteria bacterium]